MKQKVEITFLAALALFQPLSLLKNIPADVLHTDSLWDKRHPTACFHADPSSPPPSPAHVCARVPGVLQVLGTPWEQLGDSSEPCCAPQALHPSTGTGERDFSQKLLFLQLDRLGLAQGF